MPKTKWSFPKTKGTLFGGSYNKDYNIYGLKLGTPSKGTSELSYINEYLVIACEALSSGAQP